MSKYAAFISYRHGGIDEKVAIQIHKEMERYRLPGKIAKAKGTKSLGKIFRDAEELRAASNLSEIIREAIRESEWLIVLCTKRYKESVWCMEEIEYFIELRGRDRVIVVLIEGEPNESFPKILTEIEQNGEIVHIEPLAVDIRADSEKDILKNVKYERFRFLARMLDIDYDDLRQRQRERKKKQIIAAASVIFASVSIFVGTVMMKNFELANAYAALDDSMQQTLRGQSYYLAEYAGEAYNDGDRTTAALLALEALPKNLKEPERPFVESVMQSLTQALGVYDYSSGFRTDKVYSLEEEAYDAKAQISADRQVIVIENYVYTAGNMLQRKVYVYSLQDKSMICQYNLSDMNRSYYTSSTKSSYLMKDSKTLLYLGNDGLTAIDIYTGKKKFKGEAGDELVVSKKEDIIVTTDYKEGLLHFYDAGGEETLNCDLGTENKYTLCDINSDSSSVVLSVIAEGAEGLMLLDAKTGESTFVNQSGECRNVFFIDKTQLCFIREDTEEDLKHIVICDAESLAENYLCDANWEIRDVCATPNNSCVYFHGKKIYEVDITTGKMKWQHEFSSNVLSIEAEGSLCGVTCSDGQSYFYDLATKELINSMDGNGEGFYMLAINQDYACMRDYWGQNIRVYKRQDNMNSDVISADISAVVEENPDKWYTCSTNGDKIMLGYQKGMKSGVQVFEGEDLSVLGGQTLEKLEYSNFDNLSIDMENPAYVSIHDYGYGENAHYDVNTFRPVLEFNEDSYYYYNEDMSLLYVSDDNTVQEYNAETGERKERFFLPDSYDRGLKIGDTKVFGNDSGILIQSGDKKKVIEDARIYTFHADRKLLFYRNSNGDKWYVYSLPEDRVLCEGEAGNYSCTTFFGNGRYFLNDYSEVYDMSTWEKVLDLSGISNSVYGVQTSMKSPYFVVWYQNGDAVSNRKVSGLNMAYLYSKENTNEIVGVVPNYVASTMDGNVIVFDGDHTLYKVPLYSVEELVKKAKAYVGKSKLTEKQVEEYHLYSK